MNWYYALQTLLNTYIARERQQCNDRTMPPILNFDPDLNKRRVHSSQATQPQF